MTREEEMTELLTELLEVSSWRIRMIPSNVVEEIAGFLLAHGVVIPVRCEECKHFFKYNCHADNMRMNMCKMGVGTDGEDFFCPIGERKRGDE